VTASAVADRDTTFRLSDGRPLAVAEWGDPNGRPVLFFHGAPGSRLFCPDVETTERAGIRLIALDRPGYGGSDPRPGRTFLDTAADVGELAGALDLRTFSIVGGSSGGPYAMACAVALGERVSSIALVASEGPRDEVPGVADVASPAVVALIELTRADPAAGRAALEERYRWYAEDPTSLLRRAGDDPDALDADARQRRNPEARAALDAMFIEGARQGAVGLADDLVAELRPWGFSPADVRQPTAVWWGEEDRLTDRPHAEYLGRVIPGATLHILPGEGHSLASNRWAEILEVLLPATQ
jgi:pimeloyl-ACP methyl ester carboxylesterase